MDMPFDRDEVAKAVGDGYADTLGPSDMPVVEVKISEKLENYCEVGEMVCDIFKKLGADLQGRKQNQPVPPEKKPEKSRSRKTRRSGCVPSHRCGYAV